MPKAAVLQASFNCGELSPLMYGRVDSPRYKQGLATCQNYIPTLQGPLVRRPGFKFMTTVKDSTKPPVLIPFQFSISQAYILEFGNQYIRFYANMGQLITVGTSYQINGTRTNQTGFFATRLDQNLHYGDLSFNSVTTVTAGSILELQTIYTYQECLNLRFTQNDDTLYLFHPNHPVYKLQRFGQTQWEITQVQLSDGPYLPLNSYTSAGDSTEIIFTTGTSNSPGFGTVNLGPIATISSCTADSGTGQIIVTTSAAHGFLNGQSVFIKGVTGTTEANNKSFTPSVFTGPTEWEIGSVTGTTFILLGSTFVHTYVSGGTVAPSLFGADITAIFAGTQMPNTYRGVALEIAGVRISGFIGSALNGAAFTMITPLDVTLPNSTPATSWNLSTFSYLTGYPVCGTFHQDRLCVAGCQNSPQEVDGSNVGDYENFAASDPTTLAVADDNAFSFQLNSTSSNAIKWMSSNAQGLLAGTLASEWVMTPSTNAEALTPTNFNAQQTSYYGSATSEAIQVGNAAIYIQRANRKVREMNYFFQVGTFRSTDLTEISEHITLPTVTKITLQKETQPLVWGIRSDGNFISMIYDRTDLTLNAGWTRHVLGGQSDSSGTNPLIYSEAVIPSGDTTFDQLWIVVQRYINGATVYTIEYLTKIFDDSILQEDSFQLDCGGTFDNPVTMTGISSASPAVVTAAAHGFSNGFQIKIVNVVGLNKSTTDINGNTKITNLVNEKTFVVAGVTTNTFQLNDFSGNAIDSTTFSSYISGGQARKLVTTISGLTWLENETVGILADGNPHPDVVVSTGGVITLNYPAAKVQIGYRFKSQGQLLRADAGAADGTSIGKTRRTTRAAFLLHRTGDLKIGTDFNNLIPIKFTDADVQQADNATPLFSGIIREGLESAYDFESQICFEQSSPLPGQVQAITSFMEETDV